MIEEIIKEELIEIHFQPIVSIRSKQLYAFEALTRCTYKGEVIPPYELFNLAIDANLNLFDDNPEALLLRLISGTVNIEHNISNTIIFPRKNYTDLELVLLHLEESQMPTVIKDYKT